MNPLHVAALMQNQFVYCVNAVNGLPSLM
uniref:Uncharacterized protein n=1 Tax=Rhizophora mucronata TaxID=61149 RepID=A0A2P2NUK4_RHIMU